MRKATALKVLNPILTVLFINQASTGLLRDEISRETFEVMHQWSGILLIVAGVLHLVLNWSWFRAAFFRKTTG